MYAIQLRRRDVLLGIQAMAAALVAGPKASLARVATVDAAAFAATLKDAIGDAIPQRGRIYLGLPPLAESGNSVPLTVRVDSSMSAQDYVKRIVVLANRNPRPMIMVAHLGPRAGRAELSTKIRLNGTQTVFAIAEMSDGSVWTEEVDVTVTIGACDILDFNY
jgi:sulfur-oxidizing protein SoxY